MQTAGALPELRRRKREISAAIGERVGDLQGPGGYREIARLRGELAECKARIREAQAAKA